MNCAGGSRRSASYGRKNRGAWRYPCVPTVPSMSRRSRPGSAAAGIKRPPRFPCRSRLRSLGRMMQKNRSMPPNGLFGGSTAAAGEGDTLVIYTDGGSRGNPGQAAIGVVIGAHEYKERLGVKTNNEAEYLALVFALKKAKQLLGKSKAKAASLEVRMDSELVVK